MRILLTVEFYKPDIGGAQKVVEDIAVGLSRKGHNVTVATTYIREREFSELDGVKIEQFNIKGNLARGISGENREVERYRNLLTNGGFDLIFNYAAQSWPTDLAFSVLDKITASKILAPVGYSKLTSSEYSKYFNELPKYLARYDAIVYHSPNYRDKKFGDEHGLSEKAVIIGNGALESEFGARVVGRDIREWLGIKQKHVLINISHHNFNKGHRFVINAFRKMRREDVALLIVGNRSGGGLVKRFAHFVLDYAPCYFSSKIHRNIHLVEGHNRELVISAYKGADIHLFGSRLECAPLVMYESFASGAVFITTDVGNVQDHKECLKIVNTPDEMAKEANFLLDNPSEFNAIREKARELWEREHTVEGLVDKYEELFESINTERK